jgi:hypothetical protein
VRWNLIEHRKGFFGFSRFVESPDVVERCNSAVAGQGGTGAAEIGTGSHSVCTAASHAFVPRPLTVGSSGSRVNGYSLRAGDYRRGRPGDEGGYPAGDVGKIDRAQILEVVLLTVDQELNNLPDNYRLPVVLCDLEGRTRKEVARELAEGARVVEFDPSGNVATFLACRRARHDAVDNPA